MTHYFTREEAEALLPDITIMLRNIQDGRKQVLSAQEELDALRLQAMGNGHHLNERMVKLQKDMVTHIEVLNNLVSELHAFGCVLKDPDTGLIDFPSLRNGQEVYLCWQLGEDGINYWHYLDTGFAGRQPL